MKMVPVLSVMLLLSVWVMGCAAGDFAMEPSDCYSDEYYDEDDQMCYLSCELDDSCEENPGFLTWLSDLLFAGFAGSEDEVEPFITYDVVGDSIQNPQPGVAETDESAEIQEDEARHEAMWQEFTALIPREARTDITRYGIFTDGAENTMAYVHLNDDAPLTWAINLDAIDAEDRNEQINTLVHEYGHVLTLNNEQVPFNADAYFTEDEALVEEIAADCPTYFTGEGCAKPDSYVNLFYQQFWRDIIEAHQEASADGDDAIYEFYEDRRDEFVSDYAATNLGEDITESWTNFVLNEKPTGNAIADQKVLFFYDFPELVELRGKILARLYAQSRER